MEQSLLVKRVDGAMIVKSVSAEIYKHNDIPENGLTIDLTEKDKKYIQAEAFVSKNFVYIGKYQLRYFSKIQIWKRGDLDIGVAFQDDFNHDIVIVFVSVLKIFVEKEVTI